MMTTNWTRRAAQTTVVVLLAVGRTERRASAAPNAVVTSPRKESPVDPA